MASAKLCALTGAFMASVASAGVVNLSGGWQASWDSSLDGLVDIQDQGVFGGVQLIQKSAEFQSLSTISITFTKTDANAVSQIGIDDEILTNSTGTDWTAFLMSVDGGATFNPADTASSGGAGPLGFTIAPFASGSFDNGDTDFNIGGGGSVPDGGVWFPGDGATDGILFIDTPAGGVGTSFTLEETPIPAPGVATIAGLGLMAASRRRRR